MHKKLHLIRNNSLFTFRTDIRNKIFSFRL